MTVSNIFDVTQPNTAVTDLGTPKIQPTASVADSFSTVMNRSAADVQTEKKAETGRCDLVSDSDMTAADAYDRYQYKETPVNEESGESVSDKVNSAKDELEKFEEQIVQFVAEQLDMDVSDVEKVLEQLGMTAFDLLNPQNLAQTVMQLTNVQDSMELLMDSDFQNLLVQVGEAGSELVNRLNLEMNQMDELVSRMEIMDAPVELVNQELESSVFTPDQSEEIGNIPMDEQSAPTTDKEDGLIGEIEVIHKDSVHTEGDNTSFSDKGNQEQSGQDVSGHHVVAQNALQAEASVQEVAPASGQTSYTGVADAIDLIQQISEQARVILTGDTASMEMQLNPENLGKVYLHVSAQEGTVHAQLAVQNEQVKEALELQLATLRENLNQAGIRVDEVEVTIASHEFERNLEQNQGQEHRDNPQKEAAEHSNRRNIRMDSLDELSGLMTEEEMLAAQIMKDNGNSVDFTA